MEYIYQFTLKTKLEMLEKEIRPGVSTKYLDNLAKEFILQHNATFFIKCLEAYLDNGFRTKGYCDVAELFDDSLHKEDVLRENKDSKKIGTSQHRERLGRFFRRSEILFQYK